MSPAVPTNALGVTELPQPLVRGSPSILPGKAAAALTFTEPHFGNWVAQFRTVHNERLFNVLPSSGPISLLGTRRGGGVVSFGAPPCTVRGPQCRPLPTGTSSNWRRALARRAPSHRGVRRGHVPMQRRQPAARDAPRLMAGSPALPPAPHPAGSAPAAFAFGLGGAGLSRSAPPSAGWERGYELCLGRGGGTGDPSGGSPHGHCASGALPGGVAGVRYRRARNGLSQKRGLSGGSSCLCGGKSVGCNNNTAPFFII